MLLNTVVTGLLGLASLPAQSMVSARAVERYSPLSNVAEVGHIANLAVRDFDWPTLKLEDINDDLEEGKVGIVDVKNDKGKEVLKADKVFVKIKGDNDGTKNELDVYKDIKGKDVTLDILAVIVDDDDDDKALGFAQKAFDAPDARKEDLEACKEPLKKLHDAGWLHMDPNRGNYKKVDGKWIAIDFEDSRKTDDDDAYEDMDPEDDEDRINLDFVRQKTLFETQ